MSISATAEGYRDPLEPIMLPDVELTGDEFLHIHALFGEHVAGNPRVHLASRAPRGYPSPDCECCQSIMAKGEAFLEVCERMGVT